MLWVIAMETSQFRFKKIYLEISNICNLQCTFCPKVERDQFEIEEQDLLNYFKQVQPLAERVCLHVMGEPLNHKKFPLFVELAKKYQISLEITTNGTLLNSTTMAALLSPAIVQVNFSVQSFFDNFPTKDPSRYITKLFEFLDLALKERPDLYLNLRLWNLDSDPVQAHNNAEFIQRIEQRFSVTLNRNVNPSFKKSKKIKQRLYLHFDTRFEWPTLRDDFSRKWGTCQGGRNQMAIHSDGTVVPCCLDKEAQINLGNLNNQSLEDILRSDRYLKLKSGFEQGILVEKLCQSCTYATRFKKVPLLNAP